MIWIAIYIAAVLTANYTATWFIELPVVGMLAVGTIVFGVTFTARDHVHRLGRRIVYAMILMAAAASALMSLVTEVPMRIILASTVAIVFAEIADTEVYQRFIDRQWLIRVLASNSVSVPLDTILFCVIAFYGDMPNVTLVEIIGTDIVYKFVVGAIVALWRLTPAES